MIQVIDYKKSKKIFEQLDAAGTCVIRGLFSESDVKNIASKLDSLELKHGPHIMNPDREQHLIAQTADHIVKLQHLDRIRYLRNIKSVSRLLRQTMKNEHILALLSKFFGGQQTALNSQYTFKKCGTKYGKQNFVAHQDAVTYRPSNESLVSCQLSITGMNKKRGGLFLVPGSHKYGLLETKHTYDFSKQAKGSLKDCHNLCKIPKGLKRYYPEALPGDLVFMRGYCIHGSEANTTKGSDRQVFGWMTVQRDTKYLRGRFADPKPLF
tara:strand:+ start:804 stop:1604 length:801 start_codon:yes stop_codon:yes gene_type:complete